MSRIGTSLGVVMLLGACAAHVEGGGPDEPVACAQSTDCPADQVCSAELTCVDKPPGAPLGVELVPTQVIDERADRISFISGAPSHEHRGDAIAIGAGGCPAVYKYSYLLDPELPLFGNELSRNPLAWQVQTTGDVASAEYRVRTETTTELDWTPADAGADASFTATLYRSGNHGIPALQNAAQYFIDFRVRDAQQHEAIATACWDHHPLAAPIDVGGPGTATGAGTLQSFTLLANSPVSRLINSSAPVHVLDARISHSTAEPVTVQVEMAIPAADFEKTVVNDLLPTSSNVSIFCGVTCAPHSSGCVTEPADDPRCSTTTPLDFTDPTTSGPVTSGNWSVQVVDAATLKAAPECSVQGRKATCILAARAVGQPAKELIVQLLVNGLEDLRPGPGTVTELAIDGLTYTGLAPTASKFRCDTKTASTSDGETTHTCTRLTTFSKLVALDNAKLTLAGSAMTIATAIPRSVVLPGTELAAPPYIAGGVTTGAGMVWDSGDDDLPGVH